MFVTLLVFIAILGLLVFIHELGHFLAAKRNGVKVEEFAFGFKPRLFGKQIGETFYALNAVPLGGYVKLYGEHGETGTESLHSKNIFQRFQIFVAGTFMNFLLGWLLLTILFIAGFSPLFPGVGSNPFVSSTERVTISAVNLGSPAERAGLLVGDSLLAINGSKIVTDQEFLVGIGNQIGKSTTITYERAGTSHDVTVTPRKDRPANEGPLGVTIGSSGEVRSSVVAAPAAALYEGVRLAGLSAQGFVGFVKDLVITQKVSDDVTGLVGVGALTGIARRLGLEYLTQLVVVITIGLAVVNLMPILPLDGGHILALVYEKIAGKPLSEKQLGIFATAGLTFVLLIFVVVTYKDIIRFDVFGRIF